MSRPAIYTLMIAAVLLSWGGMLSIAYSEDKVVTLGNQAAILAQNRETSRNKLAASPALPPAVRPATAVLPRVHLAPRKSK